MIFSLNNADFIRITDENSAFFGGAQGWFADKFSQNGGCGVVAAANILAYLALSDEKYSALYPQKTFTKRDFTSFMSEICEYVKIRRFFGKPLGVWGKRRFERGVLRYAKSRGIELSAVSFTRKTSAAEYIKSALRENRPVAMLIGLNGRLKKVRCEYPSGGAFFGSFERHWVTITELIKDGEKITLKASSWGASAYINLNDFLEGEKIYRALTSFK